MKNLLLSLVMLVIVTTSCAQLPKTNVYKIHELCGKDKSDPAVVEKMKQLGIDLNVDASKFYQPKTRIDYFHITVVLNPQPTYENIQGVIVTWKRSTVLTYEEIQNLMGLKLPKRGAKEIFTDQGLGYATRYYVLGYQPNQKLPAMNQVTITCKKNNYNACYKAQVACSDFIHPESD